MQENIMTQSNSIQGAIENAQLLVRLASATSSNTIQPADAMHKQNAKIAKVLSGLDRDSQVDNYPHIAQQLTTVLGQTVDPNVLRGLSPAVGSWYLGAPGIKATLSPRDPEVFTPNTNVPLTQIHVEPTTQELAARAAWKAKEDGAATATPKLSLDMSGVPAGVSASVENGYIRTALVETQLPANQDVSFDITIDDGQGNAVTATVTARAPLYGKLESTFLGAAISDAINGLKVGDATVVSDWTSNDKDPVHREKFVQLVMN